MPIQSNSINIMTPLTKTQRTAYSEAVLVQLNFNDEIQNWESSCNRRIMTSAKVRRNFAAHLSQKYLCNQLDKLESSEIISRIRPKILQQSY